MSSTYQVARIFLIRLAGAPFDYIERIATPRAITLARELIATDRAGSELRLDQTPFKKILDEELSIARASLLQITGAILPPFFVFSSSEVRNLLSHSPDETHEPLERRNNRARGREQHLLLYLQRLAAKNDTFSEFGPTGWGKIDNRTSGIKIAPEPGVAKRKAFMERWTAHVVAAAVNADAETTDVQIEVPALEPDAVDILLADVEKWPPGSMRDKWLSIVRPLAELPQRFVATTDTKDRQSIMHEARTRLQALGAEPKTGDRSLYAATNPIAEECSRECHFEINELLINEVAVEAAPWIDFWRDCYAFIASRVAETLRGVFAHAPVNQGAMSLPAFVRACEIAKLPLTGAGLVAPAAVAFEEIKAAFAERLRPHRGADEYELTVEDCLVVRKTFQYPSFDEYTYPAADLQIAAKSIEAVKRGEYQWILAELHAAVGTLQNCLYWSCPDKPALNRAVAATTCGRPGLHFGFFGADFTSHTSVRLFDALPDLSYFVAPQRPLPNWQAIDPGRVEVYIDEPSGDVCLRTSDSREYLGSFGRSWWISPGFHPFQFGLVPHTPRLRCGRIIVQRRTWTLAREEWPAGNYTGISRDLILAVERLRAQKNWPRYVYIRPTEQVLRRSGAEGRDKDTKPVFIDLESYLFLEIFYRWLNKAGEIEITEMLPAPEDLLWREPDGRRTFELRALILPRTPR